MQVQTHTQAYNEVLSAIQASEKNIGLSFEGLVAEKNELGCAVSGAALTVLGSLRRKVEHMRLTTEVRPENEEDATITVSKKKFEALLEYFKRPDGSPMPVIESMFPDAGL